jgi:hypothetical protein
MGDIPSEETDTEMKLRAVTSDLMALRSEHVYMQTTHDNAVAILTRDNIERKKEIALLQKMVNILVDLIQH